MSETQTPKAQARDAVPMQMQVVCVARLIKEGDHILDAGDCFIDGIGYIGNLLKMQPAYATDAKMARIKSLIA